MEDVWGPAVLALLKERAKARQRKPGLGLPHLASYDNELAPLRDGGHPAFGPLLVVTCMLCLLACGMHTAINVF